MRVIRFRNVFTIDGQQAFDSIIPLTRQNSIMNLLKTISVATALAAVMFVCATPVSAADEPLIIGVQTWTLRNLNFDQMVEFSTKHKIKYLELIPGHIDPKSTMEDLKKKKAIFEKNGLVPYSFGVAGTSLNKEENRKLFDFAKFMGMKLLVVEPNDFRIFDSLEELVKEYDIKIAIHNHGIKSMYGNPLVVRTLLKNRDARIGVCLDAGWIASARFDPSKVFKEYEGRVYDIHLKDKKVSSTETGDVAVDTFIGDGNAKLKDFFKTLKEARYSGVLAIETDNDLKDPTEHVTKALKFYADNKP
ncbi:MAG: sugar phosphate isomerase/epimerase [Pedosphaera sp.]|nr:sugar phosphate isomerase/epimerase [Pedosphaera sp.]